jgi:hypothetical protein
MFGWRVDSGTVNTVTQQGTEHGTFNTAFISVIKSDEEGFWPSGVALFDGQIFVCNTALLALCNGGNSTSNPAEKAPTAGGVLPGRAGGPLSSLAAGRSDSTLATTIIYSSSGNFDTLKNNRGQSFHAVGTYVVTVKQDANDHICHFEADLTGQRNN